MCLDKSPRAFPQLCQSATEQEIYSGPQGDELLLVPDAHLACGLSGHDSLVDIPHHFVF